MATTTLVLVLVAIGLAYALGKRARGSPARAAELASPPSRPENPQHIEEMRIKLEGALAGWCAVLEQHRDLTEEEQARYRDFVKLVRATVEAARRDRTFDPSDLIAAGAWREELLAEAESIAAQFKDSGAAWEAEEGAGIRDGPAKKRAHEYAARYGRALANAGEINELRGWRNRLNGSADQLRLGDLLPNMILGEPRGILTPAERTFVHACIRCYEGDAPSKLLLRRWSGKTARTT